MINKMKCNPLLISTGVFRQAFESNSNYVNKIIEFYSDCEYLVQNIDGIELNIRTEQILKEIELSKKALEFIKKLSYNTIHFYYKEPILFTNGKINLDDYIFKKVKYLNKEFNFKEIVLHPFKYSSTEIASIYDFFHSTIGISKVNFENMINEMDIKRNDFETIFSNTQIGLVLDVTHAGLAEVSTHPFPLSPYKFEYLKRFYNRISYLHLSSIRSDIPYYDSSGLLSKYKAHSLFHQTNEDDLKMIKNETFQIINEKMFLPLVIEVGIKEKDISLLINEIEFLNINLRNYF
jgi:hypothetical protein